MDRLEKKWSKILGSDFVEAWKKGDERAMTETLEDRLGALPTGPQANAARGSAQSALKKLRTGRWPAWPGENDEEAVPA